MAQGCLIDHLSDSIEISTVINHSAVMFEVFRVLTPILLTDASLSDSCILDLCCLFSLDHGNLRQRDVQNITERLTTYLFDNICLFSNRNYRCKLSSSSDNFFTDILRRILKSHCKIKYQLQRLFFEDVYVKRIERVIFTM